MNKNKENKEEKQNIKYSLILIDWHELLLTRLIHENKYEIKINFNNNNISSGTSVFEREIFFFFFFNL